MPEYIYVQIFLGSGAVAAWSSLKGRLDDVHGHWRDMFDNLKPSESAARIMIHFIGDYELIDNDERMNLLEASKRAGFGVTRIEVGEPLLDPEEAFGLLAIPFT